MGNMNYEFFFIFLLRVLTNKESLRVLRTLFQTKIDVNLAQCSSMSLRGGSKMRRGVL